tara:strand:+ start:139 stop:435 length:297 start_codon:yes stop_codon:yes gene_type:complete
MDYFIVFGTIGLLFFISIAIIFKLMYQMSDLKYELKLGKINCQKDLDRLEDRINQITERDLNTYYKEVMKLEKLHTSLSKLVDDKVNQIQSIKTQLND